MFGLNGRQLFLLSLLFVALFVGSQVVPAYFNAFQFNDFIRQEVKYAVSARRTPEDIRVRIVAKAIEYDIPVGPRDIVITERGPAFELVLDYAIPIDFKVYKRNWAFHVSESGEVYDR